MLLESCVISCILLEGIHSPSLVSILATWLLIKQERCFCWKMLQCDILSSLQLYQSYYQYCNNLHCKGS